MIVKHDARTCFRLSARCRFLLKCFTAYCLVGTQGKKSWFGSLTDEHTIAWQAVMDGYSADYIYLGEWAQQLQHM